VEGSFQSDSSLGGYPSPSRAHWRPVRGMEQALPRFAVLCHMLFIALLKFVASITHHISMKTISRSATCMLPNCARRCDVGLLMSTRPALNSQNIQTAYAGPCATSCFEESCLPHRSRERAMRAIGGRCDVQEANPAATAAKCRCSARTTPSRRRKGRKAQGPRSSPSYVIHSYWPMQT